MPPAFCFSPDRLGVASFQRRLVFALLLIYQNVEMPTQTMPQPSLPGAKLSPSTVVPSPTGKASPWILDRWRDLLLFVGTPIVLIPIFTAAQARWSAQDIFLFVGAFGAMGHHLPGMIRAYGDRALFDRFKIRFVVAPIALLAVCIWSSVYNIQAIQLVALAWGIWHGMMQTYGFCRIYDAKVSARAAARAKTDLALCFAWFLAAVILSPMRFRTCLDLYYESGGPVIQPGVILGGRYVVLAALAVVTAIFVWRQWRDWSKAGVLSPIKLTLLVSSIAFWWYCNNGVQNILVGIALFEVFHDVQYLAIVWIYNRARVERDESIHGFMRFVFRRSGSLVGVYVGLVFAYGSIALTTSGVSIEAIKYVLIGIVTASALLHFYYDGFIWKVRETQTRAMLGIDGSGVSTLPTPRAWPPWIRHGLRWAVLVVPVAALCSAQLGGRVVPALERTSKVAEILPADAQAQLNYGKALHEAGQVQSAIERYESALSRDPSLAEAEFYLARAWDDLGDLDKAVEHYERALRLAPKNGRWEFRFAHALWAKKLSKEARAHYEHALLLDSEQPIAHKELADVLCGFGEYQAAIPHYETAVRLDPDYREAKENLAFTRSLMGK
jgi:Flp pilus assembly protein TadD